MEGKHVEHLVEEGVALGKVDAEGEELGLEVAHADAEHHAATRELVDRGRRLGEQERVAVRGHRQVSQEPEPGGHRGGEAETDERVERLVAPVGEPPRARHRMLRERQAVEARLLERAGDLVERARVEHVVVACR